MSDSTRRATTTRASQVVPVVAPKRQWDWEKTLAIGLLSLGTIVVVMIGIWLFGANQGAFTATTHDPANTPSTQTTERGGNNGPQ